MEVILLIVIIVICSTKIELTSYLGLLIYSCLLSFVLLMVLHEYDRMLNGCVTDYDRALQCNQQRCNNAFHIDSQPIVLSMAN